MYLREIGWEGMNCIHLAQDIDQWRSFWKRQWTVGFYKTRKFLDDLCDYRHL